MTIGSKRNKQKWRKNLIHRLASRDGGRKCFYCGKELNYKQCTLDHVVPKAAGGKNTFGNYVISCGPCNSEKADTLDYKPQFHYHTTWRSVSWHCDQLRLHLKWGNLGLSEAHAKAIQTTCKSALIVLERNS